MVLPIQLGQVSHNRVLLSRRQIAAGRVADSAFAAQRRGDGCLGRVEARVRDVGPAGGQGGGGVGEFFDVVHGVGVLEVWGVVLFAEDEKNSQYRVFGLFAI